MKDWEHLTFLDADRRGCSFSYNLLAREAQADWLFIIADDDLMLPACLYKHLAQTGAGDIIYSPPLVWGEAPEQFCMSHPSIPAVALIRRELWVELGGYDESLGGTEDRDFFQRAERARARFVRFVDGPVWIYRFHETDRVGNKSRGRTA